MLLSDFPATPHAFAALAGPTKTRVFMISHGLHLREAPLLEQVATLAMPPTVASGIVAALNDAAWTGSRDNLNRLTSDLPDAVIQSLVQALARCPEPSELARGFESIPMHVLREISFTLGSNDAPIQARAAMDAGLQFIITNTLDEDGRVCLEGRLLSDDREVDPDEMDSWWQVPPGLNLLDRLRPDPIDLEQVLRDPRWETHVGRAYWLWVRDEVSEESWTSTTEWVVEFFDAPLLPERNFRVFVADDGLDEESRRFITPRTRFVLWMALLNMAVDLDGLLLDWGDHDSIVRGDMPQMVVNQPREWWAQMYKSADRLCEAARRGDLEALAPRTPAEEALISLATRSDYVDWARDTFEMDDRHETFERLPRFPDDETWEEVLGDLTGDTDVEMFWSSDADRLADPSDETNAEMGIGDYRPRAWHRLFDREIGEFNFHE